MNIFVIVTIPTLCYFLLGFCVTLIPKDWPLLWGILWSLFVLTPALIFGMIVGMKIQKII